MALVTIQNLHKGFGEKKVLCGVDLSVPEHSIFGFVGRNGAGKTTTMKAILGLLPVDEGEILVDGKRVTYGQTATNHNIGYLPDVPAFYSFMTAREYLRLCGECLGMDRKTIEERSDEFLFMVGLSEEKGRIKGYSRGMKQRLGIAQALFTKPRLLICDEPTSALDPIGRKEVLDIFLAAREYTTVLFSTHILSDVERICTDAAFLNEGKIALCGTMSELKQRYTADQFTVGLADEKEVEQVLAAFPDACRADAATLTLVGGDERMFALLEEIKEKKLSLRRLERSQSSLETLFMEVVGK